MGGAQTLSTGYLRYHALLSRMHHEGLEVDPGAVEFATWFQEEGGAHAFEALLARGADFTAVVCGNDLIALGGYDVLRARGLSCGNRHGYPKGWVRATC